MKFLTTTPKSVRTNSDESLGHGMDAVITLLLFLGAGFLLDSLVGTMPVFMIVFSVIGSAGVFARFYYQYEGRMAQHDADRVAKLAGRPVPAPAENGEAA